MDQIFTEKQILEKCWERNTDVIQIYTHFQQAVTRYIMREFRIPQKKLDEKSRVNNKTHTGMCQNINRIFTLLQS